MLICPECKAKYKKNFLKKVNSCPVCKVKLVNIYAPEDAKIHVLDMPYGNPDLWASSTLSEPCKQDDLAEVMKIGSNSASHCYRERIWLHDALDDCGILYKIDFRVKKSGRKHIETQHILVLKEHEETVRSLIKEYNNPKNFLPLEIGEGTDEFDSGDMPQTKCPSCGKECDSDYIKCPFCKKDLY